MNRVHCFVAGFSYISMTIVPTLLATSMFSKEQSCRCIVESKSNKALGSKIRLTRYQSNKVPFTGSRIIGKGRLTVHTNSHAVAQMSIQSFVRRRNFKSRSIDDTGHEGRSSSKCPLHIAMLARPKVLQRRPSLTQPTMRPHDGRRAPARF
jgi:hypothetical protein